MKCQPYTPTLILLSILFYMIPATVIVGCLWLQAIGPRVLHHFWSFGIGVAVLFTIVTAIDFWQELKG